MPFRTTSRPYLTSKTHGKAIQHAKERGDKFYVVYVGTNNDTGARVRKLPVPNARDAGKLQEIRKHVLHLAARGYTRNDIMRIISDA